MVTWLGAAHIVGVLAVCSLGPGLFVVRRFRWRPMETLAGAVGLSWLLVYLAAGLIYTLDLRDEFAHLVTIAGAGLLIACRADVRRLIRARETRDALVGFAALFGWVLLLSLLIRSYAGGSWAGDWFEHYQRAVFFAERRPLDTKFLDGLYTLPARPPMMNLIAAEIFWQRRPSFELFQVVFAWLNALVFFACCLVARQLRAAARRPALLLVPLLAVSPTFVQNATFTWTKLFTAFYCLLGVGFYLSAWRRRDSGRLIASSVSLAAGMLVHYSTAPIALALGCHYLFALFRRRPHKREALAAAGAGLAVFGTWLLWSIHAYGVAGTFGANTTVMDSQQLSAAENAVKIVKNVVNTIVPFPFRGGFDAHPLFPADYPPRGWAYVRDWFFLIYQVSFPAMIGAGGLVVAAWLAKRLIVDRDRPARREPVVFWATFAAVAGLVGIAVHGAWDFYGVGHICLQPLVLIALTGIAVALPTVPRWIRVAAVAGYTLDLLSGILLHVALERKDFVISFGRDGTPAIGANEDLGWPAIGNAIAKAEHGLTFLGDHATGAQSALLVTATVLGAGLIVAIYALSAPRRERNPG